MNVIDYLNASLIKLKKNSDMLKQEYNIISIYYFPTIKECIENLINFENSEYLNILVDNNINYLNLILKIEKWILIIKDKLNFIKKLRILIVQNNENLSINNLNELNIEYINTKNIYDLFILNRDNNLNSFESYIISNKIIYLNYKLNYKKIKIENTNKEQKINNFLFNLKTRNNFSKINNNRSTIKENSENYDNYFDLLKIKIFDLKIKNKNLINFENTFMNISQNTLYEVI